MKPFIYQDWHVWQTNRGWILVSDEFTKTLKSFKDVDHAINWLYTKDAHAARALNRHKETQPCATLPTPPTSRCP